MMTVTVCQSIEWGRREWGRDATYRGGNGGRGGGNGLFLTHFCLLDEMEL